MPQVRIRITDDEKALMQALAGHPGIGIIKHYVGKNRIAEETPDGYRCSCEYSCGLSSIGDRKAAFVIPKNLATLVN